MTPRLSPPHALRLAVRRWLPQTLFALLAAGLLAGCATEVGNFVRTGKTYPAKPESASIDVYTNGLPARTFERVAILDVRCEAQGFMTPNLEKDGMPALIKQARAAGCDAIIEIMERKPTENWTLETKVKQYSAVGVVYK